MYKDGRKRLLCVTNRRLCPGDFLTQIASIAAAGAGGILLREKDLSETEYQALAEQVQEICRRYDTPCILHSFPSAAQALGADAFHAPLPILRTMTADQRQGFQTLGASCHSAEDAQEAQALGCTYITAGHIFDTPSKQGLPGRGLAFLKTVCQSVSIPVYAIGGIKAENAAAVYEAGAYGICVMGDLMRSRDAAAFLQDLERGGSAHG